MPIASSNLVDLGQGNVVGEQCDKLGKSKGVDKESPDMTRGEDNDKAEAT